MFTRHSPPFAAVLVNLAAPVAVAALASGMLGCSHRSYRDAAPATDQSVAGRVLGARPWDASLRGDAGSGGRLFFPLAVGNRWDYHVRTRLALVTSAGPQPPQITNHSLRDEITGTQQLGARAYFLEQESDPDVIPPVARIFPLREDRSGLYEIDFIRTALSVTAAERAGSREARALRAYVDRVVTLPAERAAFQRASERLATQWAAARHDAAAFAGRRRGGPDAGEISLLRYPLFAGARWIVRASPRFGRTVIGRERVTVPAGAFSAWRLRGTSELFGPHDRVRFWYARAGLVRLSIHFEADATDDAGNVIGRVVADEEQLLSALSLVDPSRPLASSASSSEGAEPR